MCFVWALPTSSWSSITLLCSGNEHTKDRKTARQRQRGRQSETDRPSDGSLTIADPFRAAAQARQLTKLSVYCIELIITYTYTYLHALWARPTTTTTTCGATLRARPVRKRKRGRHSVLCSLSKNNQASKLKKHHEKRWNTLRKRWKTPSSEQAFELFVIVAGCNVHQNSRISSHSERVAAVCSICHTENREKEKSE